jgi:hypothetical protein
MSKEKGHVFRIVRDIAAHGRTDAYSAYNIGTGKGYSTKREPIIDQVIERHTNNHQPIAIYLFEGSETHLLDHDQHLIASYTRLCSGCVAISGANPCYCFASREAGAGGGSRTPDPSLTN